MAYDPNQQDPNAQNPVNNPQVQPMTSSAPGGGPASPGVGKGTAPQATPQQPFQNLSAYLTANAPQIMTQAGKMAGDLTSQYGQITGDINKGVTDFSGQVQGGYAAPNQDVVDRAATNPVDFASDTNNVKAFQSLYNDTYAGPSNFETTGAYGDLNAKAGKAKSDSELLGSNEGLQTYFQTKNPNATKGGNVLDSVLLQGNPEAYSTVTNAAKPFQDLPSYLSGAVTTADQGVADAQKTAADTAAGVQNRFTGEGGVVPKFQKTLADNLTKGISDATTANDLVNNPEYIKLVSLLNSGYGENIERPINDLPTQGTIATADDFAKSSALSQLINSSPILPENLSDQAGSWNLKTPRQMQDVKTDQTNRDTSYLEKLSGISSKDPDYQSKIKSILVDKAKIGTGGSPYDVLNGFVPNGARPPSQDAIDRAKVLGRLGFLDLSKLNAPDSIWQESGKINVPSQNGPSAPASTPTPSQPQGPSFNPNDQSTWDTSNPPPGYYWIPGIGWAKSN